MTDIGIDVLTISVERKSRRNSEDDQDHQDAADHRVLLDVVDGALDEPRVVLRTIILMPGTSRLTRSTSARTPWATSTVFLPDCFCT